MKLNRLYDGKKWEDNDLVFPNKKGGYIPATAHVGLLQNKLTEHYCELMPKKNENGHRISWHTFRHTYAMLAATESRDWVNILLRD
jgi:integrase